MRARHILLSALLLAAWSAPASAQPGATFPTSLHNTRAGKNFWYGAENGGFEGFTGVPIEELGCVECHGPTDANGNEYGSDYEPGCSDCHATATDFSVSQDQCLGCHGRQKTEAMTLGYSDVHRDSGNPAVDECWDCHTGSDLHGTGEMFDSMLEPGAIQADCENCHTMDPEHGGHGGKLHCASCHAQTVISCYNCHFESQVESHVKRAHRPLHDFVILVNREKDGKIYPATFQSLTYQGDSFAAFGPFSPHSITAEGRVCTDCHLNYGGDIASIAEYNDTGQIKFASWDDEAKLLSWRHGIVPMPRDYETSFRMDFLTYTADTTNPPGPDFENWTGIGEDTWDGHQMFFATPLSWRQMESLGFENLCFPDTDANGVVDVDDLVNVILAWGSDDRDADIDASGAVDVDDLVAVILAWGACP